MAHLHVSVSLLLLVIGASKALPLRPDDAPERPNGTDKVADFVIYDASDGEEDYYDDYADYYDDEYDEWYNDIMRKDDAMEQSLVSSEDYETHQSNVLKAMVDIYKAEITKHPDYIWDGENQLDDSDYETKADAKDILKGDRIEAVKTGDKGHMKSARGEVGQDFEKDDQTVEEHANSEARSNISKALPINTIRITANDSDVTDLMTDKLINNEDDTKNDTMRNNLNISPATNNLTNAEYVVHGDVTNNDDLMPDQNVTDVNMTYQINPLKNATTQENGIENADGKLPTYSAVANASSDVYSKSKELTFDAATDICNNTRNIEQDNEVTSNDTGSEVTTDSMLSDQQEQGNQVASNDTGGEVKTHSKLNNNQDEDAMDGYSNDVMHNSTYNDSDTEQIDTTNVDNTITNVQYNGSDSVENGTILDDSIIPNNTYSDHQITPIKTHLDDGIVENDKYHDNNRMENDTTSASDTMRIDTYNTNDTMLSDTYHGNDNMQANTYTNDNMTQNVSDTIVSNEFFTSDANSNGAKHAMPSNAVSSTPTNEQANQETDSDIVGEEDAPTAAVSDDVTITPSALR